MNTIYRLRDDIDTLHAMQRGSSSDGRVGLRVTHGLIGSADWWECIADGTLPTHSVEGVISGFWPGQWGAGPAEFELSPPSGESSRWLCELEPQLAAKTFRIGARAVVEYVEQDLKTPFEGSTAAKVVLTISIE